jgi:hypothetical protein
MPRTLFDTNNSDLKYGLSGLATAPIGYLVLLFLPVYLEVVGINLSLTEQQLGWHLLTLLA